MKKSLTLFVASLIATTGSFAQKTAKDSLKTVRLEEVQVVSTRANEKTPIAFTNIGKKELSKQNFGQDIPFLLLNTPSVLTTSDAGAGIGYTQIRVRGVDASRINITSNGIPMNDAESHAIYWVNIPDFTSSLEDIQIQRGAGTSTNGAGAFGASINMKTQNVATQRYAEVSGSYGSYNTHKETFKVGTGLLNNHWAFDARISSINSDGYRDRASANLKSYFMQAGYFADNTSLKFITFGGKEKTYHAWDGISKDQLKSDRRFNPNGAIWGKSDTPEAYYDDQTDNYRQTHYQILLNQLLSEKWNLNVALHYTNGKGFYQEYKENRKLPEFGLIPFPDSEGNLIKKVDLVRKKNVSSGFGGGVFSFNYADNRMNASIGGGLNKYKNNHYGRVLWIKNYIGELTADHEYYRSVGEKIDGNIYARMNYELIDGLSAYADAQYRHINYKIDGVNDKWDSNKGELQSLDVNETFNFFNPKVGLSWNIAEGHHTYASFSVAQKEPTRKNYTDGLQSKHPTSEKLLDYELGYTFSSPRFSAGVNLYYMDYTDQLVATGKINEIGNPLSENVRDSYRMGIEISLGAKLCDNLRWDINGTWSKNRIKNYIAYFGWDPTSQEELGVGTTPIAFSPSFMGNSNLSFNIKGITVDLQTQFSTRQYLDNLGARESSLNPYIVNNLHAAYSFKAPSFKNITVGASVYNLLNAKYETNGYSQTSLKDGELKHDPRFYPMAGTNVLAHLTLRF